MKKTWKIIEPSEATVGAFLCLDTGKKSIWCKEVFKTEEQLNKQDIEILLDKLITDFNSCPEKVRTLFLKFLKQN